MLSSVMIGVLGFTFRSERWMCSGLANSVPSWIRPSMSQSLASGFGFAITYLSEVSPTHGFDAQPFFGGGKVKHILYLVSCQEVGTAE